MNRVELAKNYFLDGYGCAQSVLLAYKDLFPSLSSEELLKLSSCFSGGYSRMRETCGVISMITLILGYYEGYSEIKDINKKKESYEKAQSVLRKFVDKHGSLTCRELLNLNVKYDEPIPTPRNDKFYTERPCLKYIETGVEILEEHLKEIQK